MPRAEGTRQKLMEAVPELNLDKIIGGRRRLRGNSKENEVEELETKITKTKLKSKLREAENDLERAEGGGNTGRSPEDKFNQTLVGEVLVPVLREKLSGKKGEEEEEGSKRPGAEAAIATVAKASIEAVKTIAEAKSGGTQPGFTPKEVDEIREGSHQREMRLTRELYDEKIKAELGTMRDLLNKLNEKIEKENSAGGLKTLNQLRDLGIQIGGGAGANSLEYLRLQKEMKESDRRFQLMLRRMDQDNKARMAELGLKKEQTEVLKSGFKRIGQAAAEALLEEEEEEETRPRRKPKGQKELIRRKCEVCGADMTIPPEAQVAGKEIKCSSCKSIYEWEEE